MKICKNCEAKLQETQEYCSNCGAKFIEHRLTLKYLFSEISRGFLNIDSSRPIRTFIDLFKKPEDVIVGYIEGTRKKYINAFGYFTIAVTLASLFMFILLRFFPNVLNQLEALQALQQDELPQRFNESAAQISLDYQSLISFATIPLMAFVSRLIFLKNKRFNYAEHLVINLYAFSHVSIGIYLIIYPIALLFPYGYFIGTFGSMILYIIYYFFVLKRIYNIEAGPMVLKTILFFFILGVMLVIISLVLAAIMAKIGLLAIL